MQDGKVTEHRYRDTLQQEHKGCRSNAEALLRIFCPDEECQLAPRLNRLRQPLGSNWCGFFVLCYVELERAVWRGEGPAPRGKLTVMRLNWHLRLSALTPQLKAELEKRVKELTNEEKKHQAQAEKAKARTQKLAEEAKANLEKASESQMLVYQHYHAGVSLSIEDLSPEAKLAIQRIKDEGDHGLCSRCRFSSGCLSCSSSKAIRYHMRKLAESKGHPSPS